VEAIEAKFCRQPMTKRRIKFARRRTQVASKEEFGKTIDHCLADINSMEEV
jgi:hypothetical protein